jgi:membrane protein involved in colicin uptake
MLSMWSFFARAYSQEEGGTVRQGEGERAGHEGVQAQLPLPERGGAAQGEHEAPQTQEQREQAEREAHRAQEQHQQAEREAHQARDAQVKAEGDARRFTSDEAAKLFQQAEQMEREGKVEAAADLKKKAERIEADARESRERGGQQERAQKAEPGREGQGQAVRESDLRGEIAALRQDVKKLQDQVAELTALVRKLLPER